MKSLRYVSIVLFVTTMFGVSLPRFAVISRAETQPNITIDGDMADWEGVSILISDAIGDPGIMAGYAMDITEVYAACDSSYVYFRADYATFEFPSNLWANVTLRNDNGELFVVMAVVTEYFDGLFVGEGLSLTETCLAGSEIVFYEDMGFAAASSDGMSIEFRVPKADLEVTQYLDLVFWSNDPSFGVADTAPDAGYVVYYLIEPVNEVAAWYADSYVRLGQYDEMDVRPAFVGSTTYLRWAFGVINFPDSTGSPILSPRLAILTDMPATSFWSIWPPPVITPFDDMYEYAWTMGDVPEAPVVLSPEFCSISDKRLATAHYGYDYERMVDKMIVSEQQTTQTVTIIVTPRTEFDTLVVYALVNLVSSDVEHSLVEDTISPEPTAWLGNAVIWILDPEQDAEYVFRYTVEVLNKAYPEPVAVLPGTWIDLWVSDEQVDYAISDSITRVHAYLGELIYSAEGTYGWTFLEGPFHEVTYNRVTAGSKLTEVILVRDQLSFLREDVEAVDFGRRTKNSLLARIDVLDKILHDAVDSLNIGRSFRADKKLAAALRQSRELSGFLAGNPGSNIPSPHADFWAFFSERYIVEDLEFIVSRLTS